MSALVGPIGLWWIHQ